MTLDRRNRDRANAPRTPGCRCAGPHDHTLPARRGPGEKSTARTAVRRGRPRREPPAARGRAPAVGPRAGPARPGLAGGHLALSEAAQPPMSLLHRPRRREQELVRSRAEEWLDHLLGHGAEVDLPVVA